MTPYPQQDRSRSSTRFLFITFRPYRGLLVLFFLLSVVITALDGISISLLIPQLMYSTTAVLTAVILKDLFFTGSIYIGIWLENKIGTDMKIKGTSLLIAASVLMEIDPGHIDIGHPFEGWKY